MLNRILLVGCLGENPECTSSNTLASCRISVGTQKNVKRENGKWEKETEWIPVNIYGKSATNAIAYLRKGSFVIIEGRLTKKVWKTDEGENRSKLAVGSVKIQYGPKAEQAAKAQTPPPQPHPQQEPEEQRPLTPAQQRAAELRQERETVPTNQYPEDEIPF